MADKEIILAMQEAMRKALAETANAEIEKQKHRFECKMGEVKNEMIGRLVNHIQIATKREMPNGDYTIQIVIRGDKDG